MIYWVANNTITFTQQYTIMRSQGVKPNVLGEHPRAAEEAPEGGLRVRVTRTSGAIRSRGTGSSRSRRSTLVAGATMPWDRVWAIADRGGEGRAGRRGDWARCANFSRGAKSPELMAIRAVVDEAARAGDAHAIRGSAAIAVDPDDPDDAARLVAWVAPLVAPGRARPGLRGAGRRRDDRQRLSVDRDPEPREPRGARRAARAWPLAMERFRGNVWLDGLAPFDEFDLVGRETPRRRCGRWRCASRSPAASRPRSIPTTGVSDADTLGALEAGWGHRDFGVYAEVVDGRAGRGRRRGGAAVKAVFTVAPEPDAEALERGRLLFAGPCDFLKGVVAMDGLPPADRIEVCFAGRSNVGKSSLINALTGRKALARASNTPGRTQEINFFTLGDARYLVDLPGLRLRRGAEAGGREVAGAAARLPRRPADAAARLPAGRRAPRHQGRRRRDHGAARPLRRDLPGGADQGRQDRRAGARRDDRGGEGRAGQASGGLPGDHRHLVGDRRRARRRCERSSPPCESASPPLRAGSCPVRRAGGDSPASAAGLRAWQGRGRRLYGRSTGRGETACTTVIPSSPRSARRSAAIASPGRCAATAGSIAAVILLLVGGAAVNEWMKRREARAAAAAGDAHARRPRRDRPEGPRRRALGVRGGDPRRCRRRRASPRPGRLARAGDDAAAAALLAAVADDGSVPQLYRSLAALQRVMVLDAAMDASERAATLETLVQPGAPFRPLALEQRALMRLEAGDKDGRDRRPSGDPRRADGHRGAAGPCAAAHHRRRRLDRGSASGRACRDRARLAAARPPTTSPRRLTGNRSRDASRPHSRPAPRRARRARRLSEQGRGPARASASRSARTRSASPSPSRAAPIAIPPAVMNADWTHRNGSRAGTARPTRRFAPGRSSSGRSIIGEGDAKRRRLLTGPIVAGGIIYAMDAGGQLSAVTRDGQVAWRRSLVPEGQRPELGPGRRHRRGERRPLSSPPASARCCALDPRTRRHRSGSGRSTAPVQAAPLDLATAASSSCRATTSPTASMPATGATLWTAQGTGGTGLLGGASPAADGPARRSCPSRRARCSASSARNGLSVWGTAITGGRRDAGAQPHQRRQRRSGDRRRHRLRLEPERPDHPARHRDRRARLDDRRRAPTVRPGRSATRLPALRRGRAGARPTPRRGEIVWHACSCPSSSRSAASCGARASRTGGALLRAGARRRAPLGGERRRLAAGLQSGGRQRCWPASSCPAGAAAAPAVAGGVLYVTTRDGKLLAFQ